jgi:phage terminase large subunit-like protein
MPWQQHVADVALEVDPDTGELFYEEIVVTVPRQSGKTTLILALMVWRCLMMARRLDDKQVVTYLAQSGKLARRKLEREFIPMLRKALGFTEVPHSRAQPTSPTEFKPSMNNGSEHVLFGTGSFLQIEAPTGTGSHGDVLDVAVIDEAFAREDDLVEQAVDAATVTRRSPQTFVISTAGNERSSFLWRKVLAGRRGVEAGGSGRSCYFEWSVPDDAAYDDPAVWARYLPALGHTITVQRLTARLHKALANPDEVDEDGDEPGLPGFLRGYLNRWVKVPLLTSGVRPSEIRLAGSATPA